MSNEVFVLLLGALFMALALWAFKQLPLERWQILASVPTMKDSNGQWQGLNLTYYGLLTANALVLAVAMLIVLLGALDIPTSLTLALVVTVLLACLPASRWVARLVEGKNYTFTVAGAFFVGMFVAPLMLRVCNAVLAKSGQPEVPLVPALAAFMIAYAFGEGLGRLACISFGCCYGKPLAQLHPLFRRVFEKWNFVFSGKMKKISYASGMDGEQVVPVQAITSILYVAAGLLATLLFLRGRYAMAFVLTTMVTQGWRSVSESLRADYRGETKISAYQVIGVVAIFYSIGLTLALGSENIGTPNLAAGIEALWHPAVVLVLQALWALAFICFGKSMVTGSVISFHIYQDRI
jgi:hypothetical protein